jgi:integrase
MSTRLHHTGRWEARKSVKTPLGSKRLSAWGQTKEEAEANLKLMEDASLHRPHQKQTLYTFTVRSYAPTVVNKSVKWREQIEWACNHFLPVLGNKTFDQLDRAILQEFFDSKVKKRNGTGLGRTSLGHLRKVLHAIFELAIADDLATKNPIKFISIAPARIVRKEYLDAGDIAAMLRAARTDDHSTHHTALAIIVCGGLLGLRLGEIQAINKRIKGKVLEVNGTKTESAIRDLPIVPKIVEELAEVRFPIGQSDSSCRDALQRTAKRAGVTKPSNPHAFRHAFATGLQKLGCPEEIRARLLGHKSRGITGHYSHAELRIWTGWIDLWVKTVYHELGEEIGGDSPTKTGSSDRRTTFEPKNSGGGKGTRTPNPLLAKHSKTNLLNLPISRNPVQNPQIPHQLLNASPNLFGGRRLPFVTPGFVPTTFEKHRL